MEKTSRRAPGLCPQHSSPHAPISTDLKHPKRERGRGAAHLAGQLPAPRCGPPSFLPGRSQRNHGIAPASLTLRPRQVWCAEQEKQRLVLSSLPSPRLMLGISESWLLKSIPRKQASGVCRGERKTHNHNHGQGCCGWSRRKSGCSPPSPSAGAPGAPEASLCPGGWNEASSSLSLERPESQLLILFIWAYSGQSSPSWPFQSHQGCQGKRPHQTVSTESSDVDTVWCPWSRTAPHKGLR